MANGYFVSRDELREHASFELNTIGYREFTPSQSCVRQVRLYVRETLERVGLDEDHIFECQLIADELATNAVLHSGSIFSVAIELTEELVRIAVRDGSNDVPVQHSAAPRDDGGRGLTVVAGTAGGWGSVPMGRGKEIWADLSFI